MPEENEQISPEEKLLQVIQEGDQAEEALQSPAEEAVAEQAEPVGVPPPVIDEKPSLALAEEEPVEEVAAASAAAAAPSVVDAGQMIGDEPAPNMAIPDSSGPGMAARKQNGRKLGLATVNRCMAAAVLIIVGFAGYEVYSNANAMQESQPVPRSLVVFEDTRDSDLPPIAEIVKAWQERPILYNPAVVTQDDQDKGRDDRRKQTTGWIKYAEQNYDMIGSSGGEAIVVDKDTGKMFFLAVGAELDIKEQKITIEQISADKIILTDGKDKLTVK